MELNNEFNNTIMGTRIRQRRLELGLTQTKVAKALNVTFQQVQKYEKGSKGLRAGRLLTLSNYLEKPVNYFFDGYSNYDKSTSR